MTNPLGNGGSWRRLSGDDSARMTDQIVGLTSNGLPLASGLRATAEEMPRGRLRSALDAMAQSLEAGATLEEAVAAQGRRLPAHLKGLVVVGSRSGRMSQVLGRFVEFTHVGNDLRRRVRLSLAYPALAILLSISVILFICTSLVGTYSNLFRDFGVPLPRLTMILVSIADRFTAPTRSLTAVLFELFVAAAILGLVVGAPSSRRSVLGKLPVVGTVWRNSALSEFCLLLGLMLDCETPLGEALRLTGGAVHDASIDRACRAMEADVQNGLSLSQAITRRPVFPRGMARLLRWAEGHQTLPDSLRMAGEMFEARARSQASFAGTVLSVVAVFMIWSGIGTVVVGLLLPMITLLARLSG